MRQPLSVFISDRFLRRNGSGTRPSASARFWRHASRQIPVVSIQTTHYRLSGVPPGVLRAREAVTKRRKNYVRVLGLSCLVIAGGILSLSLTATASLRVHKDARHSDLWFHFYDDLPPVWKTARPILLREFSPRDMQRLVASLGGEDLDRNDNSVVDGCYQNDDREENGAPIITLSDTLRGDQAGLVFTHEYAHFVWDEMLNDSQRARYARLWRVQKRAHHLVTEYAQDSEEEAFADSFAYFVRRPALLQKKDAASAQFLRDLSTLRANSSNGANNANSSNSANSSNNSE